VDLVHHHLELDGDARRGPRRVVVLGARRVAQEARADVAEPLAVRAQSGVADVAVAGLHDRARRDRARRAEQEVGRRVAGVDELARGGIGVGRGEGEAHGVGAVPQRLAREFVGRERGGIVQRREVGRRDRRREPVGPHAVALVERPGAQVGLLGDHALVVVRRPRHEDRAGVEFADVEVRAARRLRGEAHGRPVADLEDAVGARAPELEDHEADAGQFRAGLECARRIVGPRGLDGGTVVRVVTGCDGEQGAGEQGGPQRGAAGGRGVLVRR